MMGGSSAAAIDPGKSTPSTAALGVTSEWNVASQMKGDGPPGRLEKFFIPS